MEQINAGNWQMIKFYLQVHAGWAITTVIDAGTLNLESMTTAELREILGGAYRETS
jgi:hypothetical protein